LTDSIDGQISDAALMTMPGTTFWVTPTFRSTRLNSDEDRGARGIRSNEVGATTGVEWRLDRFGIGIAGGYGSERVQRGISGDIETWMGGAYGYYVDGPIHVGAQFTYGNSNYDTERALPTLFRTAGANFNGHTTAGKLEGGYSWPVMGTMGTITPFAAIEFRKVVAQGFTETGAGGLNLIVQGKDESITSPQLGVRWAGNMFGGALLTLVPKLEASYTFAGDLNTDSDVMLAAGNTSIAVRGVKTENFATVKAGLFGGIGANGSLGVTGSMDFGSSQSSSSVSAVLRLMLQ
jgi:outer membrane autotransporter protein